MTVGTASKTRPFDAMGIKIVLADLRKEQRLNTDYLGDLREIKTLEKALRFLEKLNFPLHLMDVIAQDEFSHDVVVPFAEDKKFLVLGVT